MKNQILNFNVIVLFILTVMFTPGISYAGWLNAKTKAVQTKEKATPGNVQAKVADISRKLNEIHAQVAESRPLLEKLKQGKMMNYIPKAV